jgi:hypothetical protein
MATVAVFTATTSTPGGFSFALMVSRLCVPAFTTMMTSFSISPSFMSRRMNPLVRR